MLVRFLLIVLLNVLLTVSALAQSASRIDTTRGRYYRPVFRQVQVRRNVEFARVTTFLGLPQTLYMDVYEPAGDTVRRRPVVVLAHEGGFLTGTRDDAVMTDLCTRLARLGYVAATIDYRLYFFPFDTVGIGRAAIRATQDMRAAVRFFRHDAVTARRFRVHPQYVFVGGSSAGGFMALQTGYLNKASEVPAYLDLAALGGLEGSGGHAGYSSRPRGVVNLCGALARASWLEAGDPPLCSVHGTRDGLVPYGRGTIGAQLPPQLVYGSAALRTRANAVGVPNVLRRLRGAGHVPYSFEPTYLDSIFLATRDFLRPLLGAGAPGPLLAAALNPRRVAQPTAALLPRRIGLQLPPDSLSLPQPKPPASRTRFNPAPDAAGAGCYRSGAAEVISWFRTNSGAYQAWGHGVFSVWAQYRHSLSSAKEVVWESANCYMRLSASRASPLAPLHARGAGVRPAVKGLQKPKLIYPRKGRIASLRSQ